jgi:glycerol-3-phosphate cytidylyltransferase-like family protein
MFMVGSLKFVDQVVAYREVDDIVKEIEFDVLAIGPDQNHQGFQRAVKWAKENGKEVVVIPRTEGVSSTILRDYLKNND